ncbi:MAG: acyl-CoA/acyl-ACP dehydrogenase [Actinobacteria bacterium]|nr:acyl-CoA/acyl-ACP dehydrogenase [Actinomycetota bacterium]
MFDFLMTGEQKELTEEVRSFTRSIDRQYLLDMDSEKIQFPKEILIEAADKGLLGLRFPKEYGGRNLGWVEECIAIEEVATLGIPPACLYSLVSIVGECINEFGSEKQREDYLRPVCSAGLFCAEALTEPRGGSDFFGAVSTAVKSGGHYKLNGQKRFIVGAEGADYFMVYARTNPDKPARESLSCFLVDRTGEVEVKHVYGLMGAHGGGTGRVFFHDAMVPAENMVGEEGLGGKIFYRMMIPERLTSAAGALGLARASLEVAARYTTRRKAFEVPIRNFQAVSFKIAESQTKLDAARSLVYTTAAAVDSGLVEPGRLRRMVSESKKFATEAAWEIVNNAMQVMGGIGYTDVFPIERMLRDCRLIMIWTGTNEIMSLIIQHELYKEMGTDVKAAGRDIEFDAPEAFNEEEKDYGV